MQRLRQRAPVHLFQMVQLRKHIWDLPDTKAVKAGYTFGGKSAPTHPATLQHFAAAVSKSPCARQPSFRILDTACAFGEPGLTLAEAFPNAAVTVTDVSAALISKAQERLKELQASQQLSSRVSVELANAEDMPQFADHTFDVVCCSYGLMFFDHRKGLKEFHRVLKPGGLVLVSNWGTRDQQDFGRMLIKLSESLAPDLPKPTDASMLSNIKAFKGDLAAAGFKNITLATFNNPQEMTADFAKTWLLSGGPMKPLLDHLRQQGQADAEDKALATMQAIAKQEGFLQADGSYSYPIGIAHFYEAIAA